MADAKTPQERPARPCPICGKPALDKFRPFCSSRCADVDLHRWLGGHYAVPANPEDDEDGESAEFQARRDQEN